MHKQPAMTTTILAVKVILASLNSLKKRNRFKKSSKTIAARLLRHEEIELNEPDKIVARNKPTIPFKFFSLSVTKNVNN